MLQHSLYITDACTDVRIGFIVTQTLAFLIPFHFPPLPVVKLVDSTKFLSDSLFGLHGE
jgi:hypothetical protein